MPDSADLSPEERSRRIREIVAALPTYRQAEVFHDTLLSLLGELAWCREVPGRSIVHLRDPADPRRIVPWPLVVFSRGQHLAQRNAFSLTNDEVDSTLEPELPPTEPMVPPSALRGQKSGEIQIGGREHLSLAYDDDGRCFETVSSKESDALEAHLLGAVRARRGIEGLAEAMVAWDAGVGARGRVVIPEGCRFETDVAQVWNAAESHFAEALWHRRVPLEPCWLIREASPADRLEWAPTLEEALTRIPSPRFPLALLPIELGIAPIPRSFREVGFRSTRCLLGKSGRIATLLYRDDGDGQFTAVGEDIAERVDPFALDEFFDRLVDDPTPKVIETPDGTSVRLPWSMISSEWGEPGSIFHSRSSTTHAPTLLGHDGDTDRHRVIRVENLDAGET